MPQVAPRPIAVAVDADGVRAVAVQPRESGPLRARWAHSPLPDEAGMPHSRRVLIALRQVVSSVGGAQGPVVTALPAGWLGLESVRMEPLEGSARRDALVSAGRECFGEDLGPQALAWYLAGAGQVGPIRGDEYLLVAQYPDDQASWAGPLKAGGLGPIAWDIAPVALCRYVHFCLDRGQSAGDAARGLVLVDSSGTTLWLWTPRRALSGRQIPLGLQHLSGHAPLEGARWMRNSAAPAQGPRGASGVLAMPKAAGDATRVAAGLLADEVALTVRYGQAVFGDLHLGGLDLCGAGEGSSVLAEVLAQELEVPCRRIDEPRCDSCPSMQVPPWPMVMGMALSSAGLNLPWETPGRS